MRVFVLTGAIGSGKSTVAAILGEFGVPVVEADEIARELVVQGSPLLSRIVARFGKGVLLGDGSLDRSALAQKVFSDPAAKAELEAILHPAIRLEIAARVSAAADAGFEAAVVDVPLYAQDPSAFPSDGVVVVEASVKIRLARLVEGRGLRSEEALARMSSQPPPEAVRSLATWTVDNSGSLSELRGRVASLLAEMGLSRQ